jgi:Flp pilus assembly protein TadD
MLFSPSPLGEGRGGGRFFSLRAGLFCIGVALLAMPAAGDPYEADPDLASRDADYAAGKKAADKKEWAEAVRFFLLAERRNPDHADLQNVLGYSYRNLRQLDLAFKHYKRAIEIDPRHRGAHEYIGETYLLAGDLAGAQKHLAALKEICLLPCDELNDLQKAIDAFSKR